MKLVGYTALIAWGVLAVWGLIRVFREGLKPVRRKGDDNAP